jgi:hypothetical protein
MIRTVEVHDPPDEGLGVSLRYWRIPLFFEELQGYTAMFNC